MLRGSVDRPLAGIGHGSAHTEEQGQASFSVAYSFLAFRQRSLRRIRQEKRRPGRTQDVHGRVLRGIHKGLSAVSGCMRGQARSEYQ
jgi:hypothetical protein